MFTIFTFDAFLNHIPYPPKRPKHQISYEEWNQMLTVYEDNGCDRYTINHTYSFNCD